MYDLFPERLTLTEYIYSMGWYFIALYIICVHLFIFYFSV